MKIEENIISIMENKRITGRELAEALSVSEGVISNIKNGKRLLKVCELEIIAKCLNVRVVDLVTYPKRYVEDDGDGSNVEAIIQIRLKSEKKDRVLKEVFGDGCLEFLSDAK